MTRRKAPLRAARVVSYTSYAIQKRDVQFEPKISPFLWNYLKKSCSTPIFLFHYSKGPIVAQLLLNFQQNLTTRFFKKHEHVLPKMSFPIGLCT